MIGTRVLVRLQGQSRACVILSRDNSSLSQCLPRKVRSVSFRQASLFVMLEMKFSVIVLIVMVVPVVVMMVMGY